RRRRASVLSRGEALVRVAGVALPQFDAVAADVRQAQLLVAHEAAHHAVGFDAPLLVSTAMARPQDDRGRRLAARDVQAFARNPDRRAAHGEALVERAMARPGDQAT